MTKNGTPRGRIVRRLGVNIFGNPKYDRLLDRKPALPGKAPKSRLSKRSEYALQLAEKQKYRDAYGLGERQFRKAVLAAGRSRGSTGEALVAMLEARVDNVVYRLGWAPSRPAARQLVSHGQVAVNGRRLDIPSARLSQGDVLSLAGPKPLLERAAASVARLGPPPSWLAREEGDGLGAKLVGSPLAAEASVRGDPRRVVEFYAR